jgi:hypothetical protein
MLMARRGAVLTGRPPGTRERRPRTAVRRPRSAQARRVPGSGGAVEAAGRLGFACRGLIYVIVGLLAIAVAAGRSHAETDRRGALGQIADRPFGKVVLVVLAIGFLGYAVWRATEAAHAHGWGTRLASAARAVLYVTFAISTLVFLTSGKGGSNNPRPWTARLMSHQGGRVLVGAIGFALVIGGAALAYKGLRRKFVKKLKTGEMSAETRRTILAVGRIGYIARGIVYALVGVFLAKAAITFDPNQAKGIDQSLKSLAQLTYGPVLLGLVAAGLVLFGAYSFAEARYRRM